MLSYDIVSLSNAPPRKMCLLENDIHIGLRATRYTKKDCLKRNGCNMPVNFKALISNTTEGVL